MRYLLQFVIFSLISTVFGSVEISFMEGVPRLNNSLYFDYYFACHAEGEILQWKVNNSNISDYSGQSILGSVFSQSIFNCNYITTLLTLMPLPSGMSMFDSILIISCENSTSLNVVCTNGSTSNVTGNSRKGLTTMAVNYSTSVYLEHVSNQNLVDTDSSSCTNIFVCGVDNNLMTWHIQGNALFTFTVFDTVGMRRQNLVGSIVERQAILIDTKPYRLVVVLFIIDSPLINVTCGYNGNTEDLSSMTCPTNLGTTEPEIVGTTKNKTTRPMESESSTVGESSTLACRSCNILPLALGLSAFGVLLVVVVAIIVCAFLGCLCYKIRLKKGSKNVEDLRLMNEPDSGIPLRNKTVEIPLRDSNFNGIKKPKKKRSNIHYDEFFKLVQYIFLTRNKNAFNAATVLLTAPDIENTTNTQLTSIEENVYIGMIGSHPVCLVNETENSYIDKLENVIIQYFSNAKFLVFVGRCFAIDKNELKLADIVISSSIRHATTYEARTEYIAPEIRSTFCFYPEKVEKFNVTKDRKAEYLVGEIASGVSILDNSDFRRFALICGDIYGCEETSGELLSLFKNGINMGNDATKQIQVITIGAVTGYVDGDTVKECDEWQFIAYQAAFHYVASKMIKPHAPGNISYEIKKPKPTTDILKYEKFCEQIKFIISSNHPDEFDAATTSISAPNINGDTDDIIKIDNCIYIGMIGAHPIGLLSFQNELQHLENMGTAILTYFPNAKYLINVGGCYCTDRKKADLGDVLISEEICHIGYDGESYYRPVYEITTEIKNIFCNPQDVVGLVLPGNRKAKHFPVRIASARDIERDKRMKRMAIASPDIFAYEIIGGVLLNLKEILEQLGGLTINVILVNGVICYGDCEENTEWAFVATQAAFHYVCSKLELQTANTTF